MNEDDTKEIWLLVPIKVVVDRDTTVINYPSVKSFVVPELRYVAECYMQDCIYADEDEAHLDLAALTTGVSDEYCESRENR